MQLQIILTLSESGWKKGIEKSHINLTKVITSYNGGNYAHLTVPAFRVI